MADIGSKAVDAKALSKGRWFVFVEDARFLIASTRSPSYLAAIKMKLAENQAKSDGDPDETEHSLMEDIDRGGRLFARHLLLGWENIAENGAEIPYSREQAIEFCTDPRWRALYEWMHERASDLAYFSEKMLRKAEGNSQPA